MCFRPISILLLSLLLMPTGSGAQATQPSEYQIKAAFIFNFAKFVQWPHEAFAGMNSPLLIGVLGENPFGENLERAVNGKILNNRPIAVKPCRELEEAKKCHLLFISASEKRGLRDVFRALTGTHVLTVGETDGFIESGGMINFFREGNKVRFEINEEPARKAGLKIDSKLLSLGRKPAA